MLHSIGVDEYVEDVLPHSAGLWAGGRSFDRYMRDLRDLAASGYGRRRFRLLGVREAGTIVTSCKRYERELRCEGRIMRTIGIGAVFTRETHRGRGLATAMLASLLDTEQKHGTDYAFLFCDIRPRFYEEIGFTALPSRLITLRADTLPSRRIEPEQIREADWQAIARCFSSLDGTRPFALHRTPLVWELVRTRHRVNPAHGDMANLAVRGGRGNSILAYCLGRRVVRADSYVVDEFSYAPGHAHLTAPLLRAAAGDLRKVTGWLPPQPARDVLPRGTVRRRRDAILMIAPLSRAARAQFRAHSGDVRRAAGDALWSTDHI